MDIDLTPQVPLVEHLVALLLLLLGCGGGGGRRGARGRLVGSSGGSSGSRRVAPENCVNLGNLNGVGANGFDQTDESAFEVDGLEDAVDGFAGDIDLDGLTNQRGQQVLEREGRQQGTLGELFRFGAGALAEHRDGIDGGELEPVGVERVEESDPAVADADLVDVAVEADTGNGQLDLLRRTQSQKDADNGRHGGSWFLLVLQRRRGRRGRGGSAAAGAALLLFLRLGWEWHVGSV